MENYTAKEIQDYLSRCNYEEFIKLKEQLKNETRKSVLNLIEKTEKRLNDSKKQYQEYEKRSYYEKQLLSKGIQYIAGVDEVGRGPLAGPVYAAAVILNPDVEILGIKDSKKLTQHQREILSDEIKKKCFAYSIGYATPDEIDRFNILNATKLAMKRAIYGLTVCPEHLLIDALKLDISISQTSIIKGDDKSNSIGAASIVAKVARDKFMDEMSYMYPEYQFNKNKGYGTKEHINAIKEYGICEIHRKTFLKNIL
ncbi:hypothetical protein Q428_03340 [Fervidicella metallireducens AeB]|uniref:Ribonuclease HII n=1 Tax=Fervidicella metallireducens AeB TaxID=1403537 RepID=A0A017RY31_9CLOT|nr:ribonuclease HII [Fervidicella metallireducens]EYE89324.1 hypothetical protein Q428_03340 [Fervidicella metallireducens AeB]